MKTQSAPFGLIAWLANTRIHLPLIHIETRFRVTGGIATVEMDQVFEQTARESLDVTYTFPLPGDAAVNRCEMIINGRVIRAVVMEEEEARRVVAEKKAEGHRTALVEMDRDNLFTLQLGNVAPNDRIIIRLAYFQQVERLEDQLSLRIPFTPGVRYIPGTPLLRANRGRGTVDDTDQVPDASRLTPPRITGDHHDAATMHLLGVFDEGEADMRSLMSPTHVAVIRKMEATLEVELAGEAQIPNRDFVLRWTDYATNATVTRSWACRADGHTYALLHLRAPEIETMAARDDFAQDIYFLVDRSGSMAGMKWRKCAEALIAFVRELGQRDRVWITCFESSFADFAEAPVLRDDILADEGFLTMAKIGTAGGTELLPALAHVLKARRKHTKDNLSRIVLITDGQVGNEDAVKERMKLGDALALPMHCFGIDDSVNDVFLQSLARQTGGRCALMTPEDDIPAAVKRLAQSLRRPIVTSLRLQGSLQTTDDLPSLPDLNAGETTLLVVRADNGAQEALITGRLSDGSDWTQLVPFEIATDAEAPRLLWAKRRCAHLLDMGMKEEAVKVAMAHNVVCRGASFVAWDEQEKVAIAKREVYQPSMRLQFCMDAAPCRSFAKAAPMPAAPQRMSALPRSDRNDMANDFDDHLLMEAPPIIPDRAPTREEALFRVINESYGDRANAALHGSYRWLWRMRDRLVNEGLGAEFADAVILILIAWTGSHMSMRRKHALMKFLRRFGIEESMLGSVRRFIQDHITHTKPDDTLLDAFREFVERHITGQERDDLRLLLEQGMRAPV